MPTIDVFVGVLKAAWQVPSLTVGKFDSTKDFTVCVYPNNLRESPTLDWEPDSAKLRLQVKIRWGSNVVVAEQKVIELASALPILTTIDGKQHMIMRENAVPVCLGADGKGNYEYSLDLLVVTNF